MENELVTVDESPMSIDQVKNQVARIHEVMKSVMKEGEHYGIIPGTKKNTLYKSGAEKLISTFRLVPDIEVEDLSFNGEIRYRVKVKLSTMGGVFLGAGIGECSSGEDKYMWRKAVCPEEFKATAEDRKRVKWYKAYYDKVKKKQEPAYSVDQVRVNPADIANTILKMGKKRGFIDVVLMVLAASDIFSQDLEGYPQEILDEIAGEGQGNTPPEPLKEVQRKSEAGNKKAEAKKEGGKEKSPYYEFLDRMKKAKGVIGEGKYYTILGAHGFEHANNVNTKKQQDAIYQDMLDVAKGQEKEPEPKEESK